MKILAIADPHGSKEALRSIEEESGQADMLCLAGDFTIFGRDERRILERLNGIGKTILLIPGNHELAEETREHCSDLENIVYMNEDTYEYGPYIFMGIEGDGFAHEDKHFEQVSQGLEHRVRDKKEQYGDDTRFVLMTHAPPFNTRCDQVWEDEHCGNESIREFIEHAKPDFAICGHIHEDNGTEDYIGPTHVINPGPYGRIIDL